MKLKTPITELDFFGVKNQLKEYLRAEPSGKFKDFDFEGSNMSVLLDVLAYNTYQNNFYANMAVSEMFLDTAQLENSIVSHAKELNYLPRSATSAMAVVNVTIKAPDEEASTIIIPEYTRFTTTAAGQRYNFYTDRAYVARKTTNTTFTAENVAIYEGEIVDEAFFVTGRRKSIRLLNRNIDTASIRVFENFDQPLDSIEYVYRNDIFGVQSNDPVFYIEPSFDNTYEVLFGNNRFGKTPADNEQIRVFYRTTNGAEANGACNFNTTFRPNVTVTNVQKAIGGSERESINDIKFYAPRSIQIQERAVTERDYEILLKQRFNEIKDISVFGGDELDPPRFGKVAIAVNLDGGLSDVAVRKYEAYLRDKTPVAIQPIFLPPAYLYASLKVTVFYSAKQTSQSAAEIEQIVRDTLRKYSRDSLEKFGSVFEISRASALIDNANAAIVNNTIDAIPYILYSPSFKRKENPVFNFGSPLLSPCRFAQANRSETYNSFIRSSPFVYDGTNAIFEDNGLGRINIVNTRERSKGVFEIIRRNVGTVEYASGIARLSDFFVDSYEGNGIRVSANTREKNITSPKSKVLLLNDSDITVEVIESR
jgi:hypothetical protein